jgi:hypothetical protein
MTDLVAFLETLTSPQFAAQRAAMANPPACNVKTTSLVAAAPAPSFQQSPIKGAGQP